MSPQLFQCGEFSFWVKPAQQRGDCVYFSRRGPQWDFHAPLGKAASGQEVPRHIKVMWIRDLRTCQECNKHLLISSHARTQRLKCSDLRRWIQKCGCVVKQWLHFFYATDVSEENHDEVVTLIFFIQPTETRFKAMLFWVKYQWTQLFGKSYMKLQGKRVAPSSLLTRII